MRLPGAVEHLRKGTMGILRGPSLGIHMISGECDISAGSVYLIATLFFAQMANAGVVPWLAFVVTLGLCTGKGHQLLPMQPLGWLCRGGRHGALSDFPIVMGHEHGIRGDHRGRHRGHAADRGKGSMVGAVLGAIFVSVIRSGLIFFWICVLYLHAGNRHHSPVGRNH